MFEGVFICCGMKVDFLSPLHPRFCLLLTYHLLVHTTRTCKDPLSPTPEIHVGLIGIIKLAFALSLLLS